MQQEVILFDLGASKTGLVRLINEHSVYNTLVKKVYIVDALIMMSLPRFSYKWLSPRYWLTWLGIAALYLVVLLPYPWLYALGHKLGHISMRFMRRRVRIAQCNLQLCFPSMALEAREALIKRNFASVGMGIIETGMAWFWPDKRLRKWFTLTGDQHIQRATDAGRGVLLIGIHFLSLELGARMFGMLAPGIGVHRPNDNALLNWIQTRGRLRSNKAMIDRSNLRGMIRALKDNQIVWYAPDHDYGAKSSVFAPFFAVKNAASTCGSGTLIRAARPAVIAFMPRRLPHAQGYILTIEHDISDQFPSSDNLAIATRLNQEVEKMILQAPEQYMWLHRRFKTRPPGEPDRYQ